AVDEGASRADAGNQSFLIEAIQRRHGRGVGDRSREAIAHLADGQRLRAPDDVHDLAFKTTERSAKRILLGLPPLRSPDSGEHSPEVLRSPYGRVNCGVTRP